MRAAAPVSRRNERGLAWPSPLTPAPLLAPALALCAGIVAADAALNASGMARVLQLCASIATIPLLLALGTPPTISRAALLVCAFLLGATRFWQAAAITPDSVARLVGPEPRIVTVVGRLVGDPTTAMPEQRNPHAAYAPGPRTRMTLAVDEVLTRGSPRPASGLVRITLPGPAPELRGGARVQVAGRLLAAPRPQNPGEPDWRELFARQGICGILAVDSASAFTPLPDEPRLWHSLVAQARAAARGALVEAHGFGDADDAATLLDALILGQRSQVSQRLNDAFLDVGAVHFLSVSGFHVGVLASALWLLLRALRVPVRATAAVTATALVAYAVLAEPNAPVVRATTLGVLYAAARLIGRPASLLNWLPLSALFILLVEPRELLRPGFQLSFLNVAALILIVGPLVQRWTIPRDEAARDADTWLQFGRQTATRWLLAAALTCAVCWAISAPLTAHHFQMFTPWAALQSLLVGPPAVATTLLGFAALLAGWLPLLEVPIGAALAASTDALVAMVTWLGALPATRLHVAAPPAWLTYGTYVSLAAAGAIALRMRGEARPAARVRGGAVLALVGVAWLAWAALPPLWRSRDAAVQVLAVGDGSATLLAAPGQAGLVFDAGSSRNVAVDALLRAAADQLGVRRIAGVIVSHSDREHLSGAEELLRSAPRARLIAGAPFATVNESHAAGTSLLQYAAAHRAVEYVSAGAEFELAGWRIETLWPPAGVAYRATEDDGSLVLRASCHGRSLLLLGDAGEATLSALLADSKLDLRSDVLLAPRGGDAGARSLRAFLLAVRPDVVLVSSATPADEFVELVRETYGDSVHIAQTADGGAVLLRITERGELSLTQAGDGHTRRIAAER